MGEILGVGCTHRPLMLRPNEDWTFMMRAALDDPAMPAEMKDPARWPEPLRQELGNDWGASSAARGREVYRAHFAEARRVNAARGLRLPLAMREEIRNPDTKAFDPPGPNPHRCMQVGAAAARVMAKSPWRTAFVASSSWSHSFLTEKNWQLWPDVEADRRLYGALEVGDYAAWHRYTTDQIEESGQHEVLNWFCLLGAMEELGRKPAKATFIETWAFVSPVVFAYYTA